MWKIWMEFEQSKDRLRRVLIFGTTCAVLSIVLGSTMSCAEATYRRSWERTFYPSITGQVVDAETGLPIEGAVALAVWTTQKGLPGLSYTEIYKISEDVSDKDGRIKIQGTLNPGLAAPDLTVYKKGYVAWSNWAIFPSHAERTDFAWKDSLVAKMERWKEGYSFIEHEGFISRYSEFVKTKYFHKAYEWETDQRVQERDRRNELRDLERRK